MRLAVTLTGMSTLHAVPDDTGTLNQKVAQELNALRGRYGRTQADLAAAIDVSQSQMSKRLKGRVPFTLNDIERFAAYFGIKASDLLGYAESPHPVGPGEGSESVRREGLEPPTRWLRQRLSVSGALAEVVPLWRNSSGDVAHELAPAS